MKDDLIFFVRGPLDPEVRGGGVRSFISFMSYAVGHLDKKIHVWIGNPQFQPSQPTLKNANSDRWIGEIHRYELSVNCGDLLRLIRWFRKSGGNRKLLIFNSFFDPLGTGIFIFALVISGIRNYEVLISPKGEFSADALTKKRLKKILYMYCFKVLGIQNISWIVSSEVEREDLVKSTPFRILGGRRILCAEDMPHINFDRSKIDKKRWTGKCCFVGRIAPIKNIEFLIEILCVDRRLSFDIFGPVEDPKYLKKLTSMADSVGVADRCRFRGSIEHDLVLDKLAEFEVLLLPSLSENYGHVIPEALSVGCNVIVGPRTMWSGSEVIVRDFNAQLWAAEIVEILWGRSVLEKKAAAQNAFQTAHDFLARSTNSASNFIGNI